MKYEEMAAQSVKERDKRIYAWLETVKVGDIVTVYLNSTDILSGKVYEAPCLSGRDDVGPMLCVNTTTLRYGNGLPGIGYEAEIPGPPCDSCTCPGNRCYQK